MDTHIQLSPASIFPPAASSIAPKSSLLGDSPEARSAIAGLLFLSVFSLNTLKEFEVFFSADICGSQVVLDYEYRHFGPVRNYNGSWYAAFV